MRSVLRTAVAADARNAGRLNRGKQARGRMIAMAVTTAVGAMFASGSVASTNVTGFSGFSAINTAGASTGDANIGYQSNGTVFELTDGQNGEATSGFFPTAQNLSNGFTATFNYQTTPQASNIQADGAALVFQSAATGTTTALGGEGGSLGYNGMPNQSSTGAIEFNLFNGYYNFGGGTSYQTGGVVTTGNALNPSLLTGDTMSVRLSLTGTTLQEYVVDTTTGLQSGFTYTGVNLPSTLGTSSAIIGFTGATGGINSTQKISNFSFTASPTFKPIGLSGFTQNMVIPASAPQSGATAYITASMDNGTANPANNVWYEQGYNPSAMATGLPAGGSTFTSQNDSNHIFKMQSYTGTGDAILLSNSTNDVHTTGTLTLASPAAFQAISLLESSGGGPNYFNMVINYADGAPSSSFLDIVASDWFNSTNQETAWNAQGRATPSATGTTGFNNVNNGFPLLYQEDFSLPDTTDPIASITFNYNSGGGNTAIFAVSGVATPTSPILIYTGAQNPGQFNSTSTNFYNGSSVSFSNGLAVQFDDSATTANNNHNVNVASGIAPGGIVFANNTSSYNFSGAGITGTYGITLSGTGTVTLDNSNSYTGATLINSGTLVVGTGGNIASSNVTVGPAGTLNVSGGTLNNSALNLTDNGTVVVASPSLSIPSLNGAGTLTFIGSGNSTLTLTGAGTFSGSINQVSTGVLSVVMNSSSGATAALNGTSNYSGGTYLVAGLLQAGASSALGSGPIYFQGGAIGGSSISTLALPVTISNPWVFNQSTGLKFDAANPAIFTNGGTLTLASGVTPIVVTTHDGTSSNLQLSANIGGSGSLNLTGDFALTGSNTYTGGTTVNGATDVATNNPTAFGTGVINFNNGGIGTMAAATGLTIANPYQMGSNTSGAYLENYNSFTMSGPGFLGYGATFNGTAFTGGNASGGSFSVYVPNATLSGKLTGGALVLINGSNVLELSNPGNAFTGPIVVQGTSGNNQGGTLKIDNPGSLGATTSVIVASGGSFEVNDGSGMAGIGATVTITGPGANLSAASSGTGVGGGTGALRGGDNMAAVWAGNVNVSGPSYIVSGASNSGNASLTLTGSISGTGPVVFTGNPADELAGATIILAPSAGNANTYTGETQLLPDPNPNTFNNNNAGTTLLQLGANNGVSPNSGLNIVAGTAVQNVNFDLAGYNQSIQYLTGGAQTGYAIVNSGANTSILTITNGSNATISTPITGNIAIVKTGVGTQTFAGTNTYTGGTTIIGGILSAASPTALASNPVTLKGGTLGLAPILSPGAAIVTSNNFGSFTLNSGSGGDPPAVNGNVLTITNTTSAGVANSAFYPTQVPVSDTYGFTAKFTYFFANGFSDGITFVLQTQGPNAVGTGGYELGYGGSTKITPSAGIAFEEYSPNTNNNSGYGTQFVDNGLTPGETGAFAAKYLSTNPVVIANNPNDAANQPVDVTLTYNGLAHTLTESIHGDTDGTNFSCTYTGIDFSSLLGGTANGSTSAYVGFTGGDGGLQANQTISNFSYGLNQSAPESIGNPINATSGISGIQLGVTAGTTSAAGMVGAINIGSGAVVAVTVPAGANGRGVLLTPSVSIVTTGKLDLGSNDLVVTGSPISQVWPLVAGGYAGGKWNGSGIASSAAAGDSTHLTALGVIINDTFSNFNASQSTNTPLYTTLDGADLTDGGTVNADGEILVKYTYYGDTNLDGKVDGSDYANIDNGYQNGLTGWYNGDFNYDGVVDGSDYTLMDNAFNNQGALLSAQVASPTALVGGSAVPEPASLTLLGIGTLGLLGRRRRRNGQHNGRGNGRANGRGNGRSGH